MDRNKSRFQRELFLNGKSRVSQVSQWTDSKSNAFNSVFHHLTRFSFLFEIEYLWFIIVAVIDLVSNNFDTLEAWQTLIPLIIVALLSFIHRKLNFLHDDGKELQKEEKKLKIWSGTRFEFYSIDEVTEGDLILLEPGCEIPADILILVQKQESEALFVEMSHLLGYPALHEKVGLEKIETIIKDEENSLQIQNLVGKYKYFDPSIDYFHISGHLKLESHPSAINISYRNILHSGGILKSYSEVLGVIIFKGNETCLSLNTLQSKPKKIQNDLLLRRLIKRNILILGSILFISYLLRSLLFKSYQKPTNFNILFIITSSFPVLIPLVVIILRQIEKIFSNFMKGVQIINQKHFENLGHCSYLLFDKSSILTEQIKKLKFCFVAGFRFEDPEIKISLNQSEGKYEDINNLRQVLNEGKNSEIFGHLIRATSLCNSVSLTEKGFCASQEETCLLKVAEKAGVKFEVLKPKRFNLYFGDTMKAFKRIAYYSDDKGFFVFIRDYKEKCGYIYAKGIGEQFINLINEKDKEKIEADTKFMRKNSINYTILAYKVIDRFEMKSFVQKFKILKNSLVNSDEKTSDMFKKMALNIEYLSVIGYIEPKNDQFINSVSLIQDMGVNIWVTSSDDILNTYTATKEFLNLNNVVRLLDIKKESNLVSELIKIMNQKVLGKHSHVRTSSKEFRRISTRTRYSNISRNMNRRLINLIEVKNKFKNFKKTEERAQEILKNRKTGDVLDFVVFIDRTSFLTGIRNEDCRKVMAVLLYFAKNVLFFNLMPDDKAMVVRMVQENFYLKPSAAVVVNSLADVGMGAEADCAITFEDSFEGNSKFSDIVIGNVSDLPKIFSEVYQDESFYVKVIIVIILKHAINSVISSILFLLQLPSNSYSQNLDFTIFTVFVIIVAVLDKYLRGRQEIKSRKLIGKEEKFNVFNVKQSFSNILFTGLAHGLFICIFSIIVNSAFYQNSLAIQELIQVSSSFLIYIHIFANNYWKIYLTSILFIFSHSINIEYSKKSTDLLLGSLLLSLFDYMFVSFLKFSFNLALKTIKSIYFSSSSLDPPLSSYYRESKVWNFEDPNSNKLLHDFKLNFLSEYTEKKYLNMFIKKNINKMKARLFTYIGTLIIVLILCLYHSQSSIELSGLILSFVILQIILMSYIAFYNIRQNYKLIIELVLFSAILSKLIITITFNYSFELGNIIIPTCTFLVQNVMWYEFCILNLLNLILSSLSILYLNLSCYTLISFLILTSENLILLSSIIFSLTVQGYFSEMLRRNEFILIKKVKNEFFKTSSILSMLLPSFVKNRVRDGVRYISENKGEVTVIFCDIADFEKICKLYQPEELTSFLDKYFSLLDKLGEQSGCTKIETVGKTYMACAGLKDSKNEIPVHLRKESHAKLALKFAFKILEEVSEIEHKNGEVLKVKIGIHSGPVIAGVVGYHKPQFSLVGDTVNVASRMCSTLDDYNTIQISENTFQMVKDLEEYEFVQRTVEAKGKGSMNVFIVNESCASLLETHNSLRFSKKVDKGLQLESAFSREKKTSLKPADKGKLQKERKNSLVEKLSQVKITEEPIFRQRICDEFEQEFRTLFLGNQAASVKMILNASIFFHFCAFVFDLIEYYYLDVILDSRPIFIRFTAFALLIGIRIWYDRIYLKSYFAILFIPSVVCMFLTTIFNMIYQSKISNEHLSLEIVLIIIQLAHVGQLNLLYNLIMCLSLLIIWGFTFYFNHEFFQNLANFLVIILFMIVYFSFKYESEVVERKNYNLKKLADEEIQKNLSIMSNLMPQNALSNLQNELAYTDKLKNATILFADIVGFTNWSSTKNPHQIIEMLSNLFTRFDKLCVELNVYKVCTIGDCYVVIGFTGDKIRDPLSECINVIHMGFRMIEVIKQENLIHNSELNMRIGVHVGSIVQGVIGTNIIRFDIWGQDVLIANKMESNGKPGKVKCSEDVKEFLNEVNGFEYEEDNEVEIKTLEVKLKTFFINGSNR